MIAIHLKKIFTKLINIGFWLSAIVYIIACLTPYIHPKYFYPLTFLSIGFPLLLVVMIIWLVFFFIYERKQSLLIFFILLLGLKNISSIVAIHSNSNQLVEKNKTSIRVLSWNVKNFINHDKRQETVGSPFRNMMRFIWQVNADVICIQDFEQLDSSIFLHPIDYIKDTLHYPFVYMSKDIDTITKYGHSIYGTCIFSKAPIFNANSVQYNGVHFTESLGFADILINGRTIRIFNTHLRSMYTNIDTLARREEFKYVIDDTNLVFHSSKYQKLKHFDTSHINQVDIIRKVFDTTKTPFIFCADLNSVPSSYVYSKLSENLNDAFLQRGFGWQGTYSGKIPFLRIDVVLMSKQLTTTNYFSPRLNLSDHYPVVADISFK
jgi:endonuclease/exonuclease/phosphatase family metal-dependent hydrolase